MAISELTTSDIDADHSSEFTNGAIRCMRALSAMEKVVGASGPEYDDSWLAKEAATNTLLAATGKQSEFMRGFLTVMAEYVCMCSDGGVPDLDGNWKPDAMMTKQELARHRQELLNVAH